MDNIYLVTKTFLDSENDLVQRNEGQALILTKKRADDLIRKRLIRPLELFDLTNRQHGEKPTPPVEEVDDEAEADEADDSLPVEEGPKKRSVRKK